MLWCENCDCPLDCVERNSSEGRDVFICVKCGLRVSQDARARR